MDKVKKMERVEEAMRNKFAMLNNPKSMAFLKMSLVPVPCQECMLGKDGHILSETLEWLQDLKDDLPVWSRLITMNTSAFCRNIPLSKLYNYDIEVDKRLWSLWGSTRYTTMPECSECNPKRYYIGANVIALCMARLFNLNVWSSTVLDIILKCGKVYWKDSIKDVNCPDGGYNIKHLNSKCNVQGVHFYISIRMVSNGELYGSPMGYAKNLAWCLSDFFRHYQFGILESFNRCLAFGVIRNTPGSYFMFDAQTKNYPLFQPDLYAPYILRTNHLQILLYCLVVAVKAPHPHTTFTIYQVSMELQDPEECLQVSESVLENCPPISCQILPDEFYCTPLPSPRSSEERIWQLMRGETKLYPEPKPVIYRHPNKPNLIMKCLQDVKVRPMVDYSLTSGECIHLPGDWLRIICSDTVIPKTQHEIERRISNSFVCELNDLLATGCAYKNPPHIPCECDRWGPRYLPEPRLHPCAYNYKEITQKRADYEKEIKLQKLKAAQERQ